MAEPYGMSALGTMVAKSSMTGLVDRTERNGLVRREPDPRDTRAVRVALTPRGHVVAEEFYAETCRRIDKLPAGLSAGERDALAGLLGRVVPTRFPLSSWSWTRRAVPRRRPDAGDLSCRTLAVRTTNHYGS